MFYFHEFLERVGIKPNETKLLRHNPRDFTYWVGRELDKFGCYASFQKKRLRFGQSRRKPKATFKESTVEVCLSKGIYGRFQLFHAGLNTLDSLGVSDRWGHYQAS